MMMLTSTKINLHLIFLARFIVELFIELIVKLVAVELGDIDTLLLEPSVATDVDFTLERIVVVPNV
jgi:hypothetical protein